jgi:hypothetical protein
MAILVVRTRASDQSLAQARAHVLRNGELGLLEGDSGERWLVVGDGIRTVGQLVDAGDFYVRSSDLP